MFVINKYLGHRKSLKGQTSYHKNNKLVCFLWCVAGGEVKYTQMKAGYIGIMIKFMHPHKYEYKYEIVETSNDYCDKITQEVYYL